MNKDLSKLSPRGGKIKLRATNIYTGSLLNLLKEAFDINREIVINDFEVDDSASVPGILVLKGNMTLFLVETEAKLEFRWKDEILIALRILAKPPSDWKLIDSFPHLMRNWDSKELPFGSMRQKTPVFILTTSSDPITDDDFGLKDEVFYPGVSFFSPKPAITPTFVKFHLNERLSEFGSIPETKCILKGRLLRQTGKLVMELQLWWRDIEPRKVGDMKVLSSVLEFRVELASDATLTPDSSWGWELKINKNEDAVFLWANLSTDRSDPLIFEYRNQYTTPLLGGIDSLKTMVNSLGSVKKSFSQSDSNVHPRVAISWFSYCPGHWLLVRLILTDGSTNRPYRWKLNDLITIDKAELTLNSVSHPSKSMSLSIAGVMEIDGYHFAADYYPKNVIHAKIIDPISLDLETFLTHTLGQPLGLPHTNIELVEAQYSQDLDGSGTSYSITLGGHVDLLGNGRFLLESLGCSVSKVNRTTTDLTITGTFKIVDTVINVIGQHTEENGWEFEGIADMDWTPSVHDMVDYLTRVWDAEAPPGIPDIQLKQIDVTVGAKRSLFGLRAQAILQLPEFFPLGAGKVDVMLDVRSEKIDNASKRETRIEAQWQQSFGDKQFLAEATYDNDGETFFLSWNGGKEDVLGLKELHKLLELDHLFELPEGGDWAIFEFHRASMSFASSPRVLNLAGESSLGPGTLEIEATLGKESRSFSGTWSSVDDSKIGLDNLLEIIGLKDEIKLANSFGADAFMFNTLSMKYECSTTPTLQFIGGSGKGEDHTDLFFVAQKPATEWGFVVGTSISDHSKFSNLHGFKEACKLLSVQPKFLYFSSLATPHFLPPIEVPELNKGEEKAFKKSGALAKANSTNRHTFKLDKGATLAANVVLEGTENPILKIVHDLIGIDELNATISAGPDTFAMTALIPGQLSIPTGSGKDFILSDSYFGIKTIADGELEFQVAGSAIFHLFGKNREIDLQLDISEEAAVANVHLTDIPLPSPQSLPGVIMNEDCWLEMGTQFEPPGMDLGFMGSFYIGDDPSKYTGEAVFVLEIIEGIPNPLYCKFSIDRLDLWAMFEAMTGTMRRLNQASEIVESGSKSEAGLEFLKHQYKNLQSVLKKVALENVAFHWADSVVILPDGTTAMPGVGFRGTLDIFGWKTFAAFEFSVASPTRLSARFEMESIHLNHVLSITGDGKGVLKREATGEQSWDQYRDSSKWVEKGSKASTSPNETTTALKKVIPTGGAEYLIPPGGPVFIVSSQHSPFLHADMRVELFDLLHAEVKADVDEHGLAFEIKTGIGSIAELDLRCKLGTSGKTHFEASGRFSLHLHADIPIDLPLIPKFNIPLSAGLDAEVDLRISDTDFECIIQGSFEFEGVELHMPKLTLDVPFTSFTKLPAVIIEHIIDNAGEIFADIADVLADFSKLAAKELEKVGEAIDHETELIGKEAVKTVDEIGKGAEKAFDSLEHGLDDAADKLENEVKDTVDKSLHKLGVIGDVTAAAVDELMDDAKTVLHAAEETVKFVLAAVTKTVEAITHAIADVVAFAGHAVAAITKAVGHAIQAVFDVARKAAQAVMKAAEAVVDGLKDAAEAVLHAIGEVGKQLANIARALANAFKSFFHGW